MSGLGITFHFVSIGHAALQTNFNNNQLSNVISTIQSSDQKLIFAPPVSLSLRIRQQQQSLYTSQ